MIGLYCPDVPPVRGGVADHTLLLARALRAEGADPIVLARRGDPALFAPGRCVTGLAPRDVPAAARAHGLGSLVVQYVPFLYARRGVSPALVRCIEALAGAGVRVAVIVHEPFVPFTRAVWLLTGIPMRWQFGRIVRRAWRVYTPVPRYAELARRYGAQIDAVVVAPIGATLPISTVPRAEARRALALADDTVAIGVFSPAAAGFALGWITGAAQRLASHRDVVWVRFGYGSDVHPRGPLPPAQLLVRASDAATVAATARALDIAAAPYVDGLTLRRSGAMLALAHGVATVTSTGSQFDPTLAELAACEPSADAFATRLEQLVDHPAERAVWAARASGYASVASVEVLARRLARDLGVT